MYQCPNCGGGLRFDILSQQMKCDFCQTLADPLAFSSFKGAQEDTEFEVTKFLCNQCGAEIISQDNTAAAFCSFCGASTLLMSRLSREKKPDAIIPFKRTKEDCISAYLQKMKHSFFAPNELKDAKCVNSFRGIYMPYWVYDVSHKGGFRFHGVKTSRQGSYDITRHFDLTANIDADYQGVTHDAAKEFSDDISESLAPYNIREMQHFNAAYLSGFYADTYDVSSRIYDEDVLKLTEDLSYDEAKKNPAFRGYTIKRPGGTSHNLFNTTMEYPHYAMLPVWFMSYRKGDRVAYVTINGQTGKISADVPVDYKKYTIGSLLLAIPIFLLLNFAISIKAKSAMVASMIIALITFFISISETKKIIKKDSGVDDKGLVAAQPHLKRQNNRISITQIFKKRWAEKKGFLGITLDLCTALISLLLLIFNPVSDYFYYGGAVLSIIAVFLTIVDIMRDYNILATRKLPQFNREGGDDGVR